MCWCLAHWATTLQIEAFSKSLPSAGCEEALASAAATNLLWRPVMHTPQLPGGVQFPARKLSVGPGAASPASSAARPAVTGGGAGQRVTVEVCLEKDLDGVSPFTTAPIPFSFHPGMPMDKSILNLVFVLKNRGYKQFEGVKVSWVGNGGV